MSMIITSECEDCFYGSTFTDEKGRLRVLCSARDKTYWFGQCIPCEDKKKRIIDEENS